MFTARWVMICSLSNGILQKWYPCAPDIVKTDVTKRGCSGIANGGVLIRCNSQNVTPLRHEEDKPTSRQSTIPSKKDLSVGCHGKSYPSDAVLNMRSVRALPPLALLVAGKPS